MEHFNFVSDKGKISLPSKSEIFDRAEKTGEKILLILDSSVCIDIIKLVNYKKKANSDKMKIFNLIDFVQKNNIDYLPILALVESCYDREALIIQPRKLFDYKNKLQFAFEYSIKEFKKLEYNLKETFFSPDAGEIESELLKLIIDTRINPYYAGLLKISHIAQKGLGQNRSEKNIDEFINWMENELGFFLGLEYTLALQIFGGNSKFGSMLKIGAKKDSIIKATWGSAWDVFHAKMSINKEMISEITDQNVYPIFVTKDVGLFNLMSPNVHLYMKHNFTKVTITKNNEYPPNYSKEFIGNLNERIAEFSSKRFNRDVEIDVEKIKDLIKSLEESII